MRFIFRVALIVLLPFLGFAQQNEEMKFQENKLLEAGKFKDAVKYFSKAIATDNTKPVYYYKRALAYRGIKDIQQAHDDLTTAIKLDGTYALAYLERGILFSGAQMYSASINDLDMAVKYAKDDSILYHTMLIRSSVRLSIRNFSGAFEDSKAFYDHDTTSRDALVNMALSKLELNQHDEAVNFLQIIIDKEKNDTMALLNMGYVYIRMEKYDSALYYLNRTCQLDPKNAYALSNLSYAKLKEGRPRDGLIDINESLKYFPENSYAFRNRALIYLEINEKEKACMDLRTAVKKGFTEMYGNEVLNLIDENCKEK